MTGVKTGVTIAVVVAFIVSLCGLLYMRVTNPHFNSDMISESENSLKRSGVA